MSCTTLWKSLVSSAFVMMAAGLSQQAQAVILQIDTSTPVEFPNTVVVPVNVAAFTGATPDVNGITTITGTITYAAADLDFVSASPINVRFEGGTTVQVSEPVDGTLTFTAVTATPIVAADGTVNIVNLTFSSAPLLGGAPTPNQTFPRVIEFNEGATTVLDQNSNAVAGVQFEDNLPLDILTPQCLYSLSDFAPVAPTVAAAIPGVNFPVEYLNVSAEGLTGYNFRVDAPLGCSFNVVIQSNINQALPLGALPFVTVTGIAGEAGLGGNGIPSGTTGGNGTNRVTFDLAPNNTGSTRIRAIRIAAPDLGRSRFIRIVQDPCSFTNLMPMVNNAGAAAVNDFNVTFDTTCNWEAFVVDPTDTWVLNSSGVGIFTGSGTGVGADSITYDLAANLGPARSATIRVRSVDLNESTDHTINQASGCEVIDLQLPSNASVPAAGQTDASFTFTLSDAACITETTVTPPAVGWITDVSAPVALDPLNPNVFTVTYDVSPNIGPARGPVDFEVVSTNGATLTHTVDQLSGCTLTINPTEALYAQGGQTQGVAVDVSDDLCEFTVVETEPWLSLSATMGTGDQTIDVTADPNPGAARSAIVQFIDENGNISEYLVCQEGNSFLEAFFYGDTETDIDGEDAVGDPQGTDLIVDADFNQGGIYIDSSEPQVTITGVPAWIELIEFNGGGDAAGDIEIANIVEVPNADPLLPSTFTYTLTMNDNDGVIVYNVLATPEAFTIRQATMTLAAGGGIPAACAALLANEVVELDVTQSTDCLYNVEPLEAAFPAADDIATVADELAGTFTVFTNANDSDLAGLTNCSWAIGSAPTWVNILGPENSSEAVAGNSTTVEYTLDPNPGRARSGEILIATENGEIRIQITQEGACNYALSDNNADANGNNLTFAAPAAANQFTVNVTAAAGCAWTIMENSNWLEIEFDPAGGIVPSGSGNGTFRISLEANAGPARSTTIFLLEQGASKADKSTVLASLRVEQASGCVVLIDTFQAVFPANEAISGATLTNSFPVSAGAGCSWSASTVAPWITLVNGSGLGNGFVIYTVAPNVGPRRSATITVGALNHVVVQESGCVISLSETTTNISNEAVASQLYTVTTSGDTCTWRAVSNSPWITVVAPAGGNGTGSTAALNNLQLAFGANTGPARSGTVTVTGDNNSVTITVNQADGCFINAFVPNSQTFNQDGGSDIIPVTFTGTGVSTCDWDVTVEYLDALDNVITGNWLTFSEGIAGTGNGFVNYQVAPYFQGGTRRARITVTTTSVLDAGSVRTFLVTQTDECLVDATPAFNDTFNQDGGFGEFLVDFNNANASNCPWTASVDYNTGGSKWITINSAVAGNGDTQVTYSVAPYYGGGSRSARIVVLLQNGDTATHVVTQTDNCAPVASPAVADAVYSHSAQTGEFSLTGLTQDCPWTATIVYGAGGPINWVTLNDGNSGTGNSTVNYSIATFQDAEFGTTRTATIRVVSQNGSIATHEFTQVSDCTFADPALTPLASVFDQRGGARNFTINLAAGGTLDCDWTVASTVDWIAIVGSTNGFGNSSVEYSVEPYILGGSREGTIVVTLSNGQTATFTVTQNDGCDVTVSASSSSVVSTAAFDQNGGAREAFVTFAENGELVCEWSAISSADWIELIGDTNGAGDSTLAYNVKPFYGTPARVGTITVLLPNGDTSVLTITQTDACDVAANPTTAVFNQNGGSGAFLADFSSNGTMLDCPFNATVTQGAAWVTITGTTTGEGDTTIEYSVAPYFLGGNRVAVITVTLPNGDSATHTITQTDECVPSAVPNALGFNQNGGTGNFEVVLTNVNGRETCPYAVSTTANWVTITGDGNGVGNSTVQYRVDPYFLGGTRQATIVITLNNGLTATHTITQTDECVVSVDATTSGFNQNGGSGNFAINLQQSGVLTCPWEASTTANWVTIASDSNGTGNSELSFTVDPWFLGNGVNAQRTATIVVRLDNGNTATHTITQTNECDVTAVPATAEYEQGGGFGQFTAQFAQANQLDCPWNVTVSAGDEEWVTIVGTTEGTGTSTISYEVKPFFTGIQPNPSRTAVITVTLTNGDTSTHTITQVDNCNHTLVPTSLSFTNRAEFGSFNVNFTTTPDRETQYQCPWIARVRYPANAVDTDWVEIVEGSTEGSGDGLVTFYVDEFNSLNGERTAFIDVILDNGLVRTFTIIQRDPCQFAVTPSVFYFDHNGVLTGPVFDPLNAPIADDNTGTAFITVQFLGQPFGFNYADCEFSAYVCTSNAKCSAPVTIGTGGEANPDESWINIQEITVNQASGEAQVFFEVDPNIVTGPDQGRFAFIVIEGKNGQIATVRVEQSSSYFRLGELELADTSEFDAPGGLVVDQQPFGFGENAIVVGYTDILDNQVIEQEGLPNAPYFTVVDPKTGQTLEAELSVVTDQRGFITGFVTLNNFINETSFDTSVLSSTQEADATVTIPVKGRIVYRRSSVTQIQTDENNFAGTTDVTYNSSFVISGKNKFASFKATGTDKRKEVHQFTPGQSLGFDVVVTAAFKTGNTNAKGTERSARLYGWNPTVVDLAVNKNSFLPKDSRKRVFDAGLVLLDSDYSVVGEQGVGAGLLRQFPQIGSKNGKYTFTGKFSSFPQITFRSVGLHNANQEVFLEEGFPLYLLERGVNVFPQSTVFSNGQVTITGRNVWAKNLTVPQNPSN